VLVLLVSIDYLLGVCDPVVIPQVFSPTNVVFSGIGILLLVSNLLDVCPSAGYHDTGVYQAAIDADASQDVLVDIFMRIECFFRRLESYTEVPPTDAMADVIVKIMVEVLSILAIATKDIKQGRRVSRPTSIKLLLTYFL
jgi:hypothetical protein